MNFTQNTCEHCEADIRICHMGKGQKHPDARLFNPISICVVILNDSLEEALTGDDAERQDELATNGSDSARGVTCITTYVT
jgi:hypothetical protein